MDESHFGRKAQTSKIRQSLSRLCSKDFFIEIDRYSLFLPEFKNGKPVKFTRESGCLARDELLVISKGGL